MDDVKGESIGNFSKFASSEHTDRGRTRIPQLQTKGLHGRPQLSKSNDKKSKALHKTFFPPPGKLPPEQEAEEISKTSIEFKGITRELIREVTKKLKQYKAPGIDDFPNKAFK